MEPTDGALQPCGVDGRDTAPLPPSVSQEPRKPACPLVGTDGNVFAVIGNVARCLRNDGQPERAREWIADATASRSYDAVLQKVFTYVDPK